MLRECEQVMPTWVLITGLVLGGMVVAWAQQADRPQNPAPPAAKQIRTNPDVQKVQPLGDEKRVQADDIDKQLADGTVLFLDVREAWEIEELGTREGYVNIPLAELPARMNELPKDKTILTA